MRLTYNLGATGLRGWIFTKAANNLDAAQGRTTLASRQILVTHVGAASPADGVVMVDDVILGGMASRSAMTRASLSHGRFRKRKRRLGVECSSSWFGGLAKRRISR